MGPAIPLAEAGLLDINGTLIAEVIAFLLMLAILARWVYPPVMRAAEARQKQIQQQLEEAERARNEAEQRLRRAEQRVEDARSQADEIIAGAGRQGEQLRSELRRKADEEAKRMTQRAQEEIESEKQRAIRALRADVANLVVTATAKVVGETLDDQRHRKLIDEAIQEAAGGDGKR